MKSIALAISLASLIFAGGCARSKTLLIGGERVVFYPAGSAVPAVDASTNADGWYSLSAIELDAILNP